jgi:hypothetical protein
MNNTRTVAVRLDNLVAQEYERLAQLKGDKLGTYLRDLLTSNIQMASIERQVSRVEELVNEFEKDINRSLDKFTQQNGVNEKLYEDFGHIYMFHLGALMQAKVEKEDIRKMQSQGTNYANRNYLGEKKDE